MGLCCQTSLPPGHTAAPSPASAQGPSCRDALQPRCPKAVLLHGVILALVHLPLLNFRRFLLAHSSKFVDVPVKVSLHHPLYRPSTSIFKSSTHLTRGYFIPSYRPLMETYLRHLILGTEV